MVAKKSPFNPKRVSSFQNFFNASEEATKHILSRARWAIPLLNQVYAQMDDDVAIEKTTITPYESSIMVIVRDWNTSERLSLLLLQTNGEAIIRLHPDEKSKMRSSTDLIRVAHRVAPDDPMLLSRFDGFQEYIL